MIENLIKVVNTYKPLAHDLSAGILLGYHRLFEMGKTKITADKIIQETPKNRKVFCLGKTDTLDYNDKTTRVYYNGKIESKGCKDRINIIHNVDDILNRDKYPNRSSRKKISKALNFIERNETKLTLEDITSRKLNTAEEIFQKWKLYKEEEKNLMTSTFPSYYLALKRVMNPLLATYKKLVFYDGEVFGYTVYDVSQGDRAFLISFIPLYFEGKFPGNLSNHLVVRFYQDFKSMGIKEVNTGTKVNKGLELFKRQFLSTSFMHSVCKLEKSQSSLVQTNLGDLM